jgi:pimeloyl-ACP methyl ester carboxylesterase
MKLERAALWGHSDGAITAAMFAAEHPERASALVVEAIHFHRAKSRGFFEKYAADPGALPQQTIERLHADHGERWRTVVAMHSSAWLAFIASV